MAVDGIDRSSGTWKRYVQDHLLRCGLVSPVDMRLFKVTDRIDVAIDEIRTFYRVYHSSRYVGDRFVIRLSAPLPPSGRPDEP